ncbi:MAG: putative sugar O-methyltransferase [Vicinamibacterales bacterium]
MPLTPVEQRAWDAYPRVREAVLAVTRGVSPGAAEAAPSTYWREELENIDYLLDATPLILRKLRQHAVHVTNLRPHNFREKQDGRFEAFVARLESLRALAGDELLVPESPALGGFGFDIDGRLFNTDTIKFYEVLAGMKRAGALEPFSAGQRRVVWEIGAGWGGFAYQFKTLFPNTTYVITDLPELFLFSAVYLMALFPDARVRFVGADTDTASAAGWLDVDFVFVPNTLTDVVAAAPVDLTVNMVSFQEMTTAQVREYASIAARAGCRSLYSLNRERSPFNAELSSVSDVLGEQYDLREIAVLETDYTTALKKPPKARKEVEREPLGYRHLAGSLRAAEGRLAPAGEAAASLQAGPKVVLGMTLYNSARYLREAANSILSQTSGDFALLMLDDASGDDTARIAREYEQHDPRVRYARHEERQGMVPTWREVATRAAREYPSAEYFAWVSDHDRWHADWLAHMAGALDAAPDVVMAYPVTQRMDELGNTIEKEPRSFQTTGVANVMERWRRFCHDGVGSGDMVYGLMRVRALEAAGTFRSVLNPDRLLIAELTLQGQIRQVDEPLWWRRRSAVASIARQRVTLFAGPPPRWFGWPPPLQHAFMLMREYLASRTPPVRVPAVRLLWMLTLYQLTSAWRHYRKTEFSKSCGRGIDNLHWVKKLIKKGALLTLHYTLVGFNTSRARLRRFRRKAVYETLVTVHKVSGQLRRAGRRARYELLMLTHRTGLRGPRNGTRLP